MKKEIVIKRLARDIMDYADRKSYGLGEVRWELNRNALDEIDECDGYLGFDDAYDTIKTGDDACTGDHAEHIRLAKELANEAYDLAGRLQDMGVTRFD